MNAKNQTVALLKHYLDRLRTALHLAPSATWTEILATVEYVVKDRDDVHKQNAELHVRQQEHLRVIRQLSTDSISPEEADELRGQVATLVAEVGTLRSETRSLADEATILREAVGSLTKDKSLPTCRYCGSVSVYDAEGGLPLTAANITACAHCGDYQQDGPPVPFGAKR
jgi:hypothetical protein